MARPFSLGFVSLLSVGALLCAGCKDDRLRDALPPGVRIDTYVQQSASKVDVLWVVDNSGSMAPRQENLARNFQAFIDLFTKGAIDYRLAITTTDVLKDDGQLKGSPKIISPKTSNPAAVFAANVRVGINGSPYEEGLEAAQRALERQRLTNTPIKAALDICVGGCAGADACITNCNAKNPIEFLRPDAYLYLIFVSDEEDRSARDVRYYYRSYETTKGIGNDGTVTTAAIVGEVAGNSCSATLGKRYLALSELTGGDVGSICDENFAKTLRKLATSAVGLRRKFAVGLPPNVSTLKVSFRYPCNVAADVLTPCASVDRSFCDGKPAEAVALVCSPQQGGPDGWTYEENTRLVYFAGESVPGLNAQVELQYYEEGKGP